MRVLYVIAMYGPEYLGNLIHRELGHEFLAQGHTFDVFALADAREMHGRAVESVEDGIRVHRAVAAGRTTLDLTNALAKPFLHYDRFGAGWLALHRYLAANPPYDILLAEGAFPFGALSALASTMPTQRVAAAAPRLIITVAGGDFIDSRATNYGYGRFRTARRLMRHAFQNAAAIRVTTPLVRERVLELGAPAARIALIPRNIASYCYPPPDIPLQTFRAAARRALASKYSMGDAHILAAVGRLLPIKGFDTLIRALPRVLAKAGNTRLLLVGPNRTDPRLGDYRAHLETLAAAQRVSDKIWFTGALPHTEMRALLAAADALAVPSVLEGMNKVAVEAAAVGTPSIVHQTAGIADLLREAGAGEIVAEPSPDALADGISRVLCDDELRAAYAARGLEFAQHFSSARIGAQLISLCSSIKPEQE